MNISIFKQGRSTNSNFPAEQRAQGHSKSEESGNYISMQVKNILSLDMLLAQSRCQEFQQYTLFYHRGESFDEYCQILCFCSLPLENMKQAIY